MRNIALDVGGRKRQLAGYLAACFACAALLCGAAGMYSPDRAYAEEQDLHLVYCYDGLAEDFSLDVYQHIKLPGPPADGEYAELNERIEGWYLDRDYAQPAEFGSRIVESYDVLTLYPKWKPVQVTYNYGGVKPTEQFPVSFPGAIFNPLSDTPPAGKTHDAAYDEHILGWYWDPACTDECDMSDGLRTVFEPVLYAKWDTKIIFSYGESMESIVRDWSLTEPPENPFVLGWQVYDGTGTPRDFDYLQPTVAATPDQTYHYMEKSSGESELTVIAKWDNAAIAKAIADQNDPAQAAPYRCFDQASRTMKQDVKRGLWKISSAYKPAVFTDEQILSKSWYLPNPGWYVLTEDVTYDEPIVIRGDVRLILKDGCTLTANQGIIVEAGNRFSVYGNSTDEEVMGSLAVTGSTNGWAGIGGGSWRSGSEHARSGDITIDGGNVSVTSTGGGAGIGGGLMGWPGLITINGGNVTAQGSGAAAGIGAGDSGRISEKSIITINGGTIRATSGGGGAGAIGAPAESMFGPHEYTIRVADNMIVRVGEHGPESTVTDLSQVENALNNAGFAWLTERGNEDPGNPISPDNPGEPGETDDPSGPDNPGDPDNPDCPDNHGEQTNPQTGDNSFRALAALFVLMLGGFAVALFARRNGNISGHNRA